MNVGRLSAKHVTIDKWHVRACLLSPGDGIEQVTETVTPIQYRRVEAITAQIAEEKGLKAYQLQAIIWVTIKEAWNR
jgi:thermostable 8-oxoguanine DNA glycosylase